jgi:hypothetical protein
LIAQTRRIWKGWHARVGGVQKAKVEMISREYFAILEVLDRWEEALGDISEENARAEGYPSVEAYRGIWVRINRKPWDPREVVKVAEFRVLEVGPAYLAFVESL